MSLVDKIQELCKANGIKISNLQKTLGFGNASIYKWDENSPSIDKVLKVADYFGVSLDYLMGRQAPIQETIDDRINKLPAADREEIERFVKIKESLNANEDAAAAGK